MIEFLVIAVIILGFIVLGMLIFIWWQFSTTDNALRKIIKREIALSYLLEENGYINQDDGLIYDEDKGEWVKYEDIKDERK